MKASWIENLRKNQLLFTSLAPISFCKSSTLLPENSYRAPRIKVYPISCRKIMLKDWKKKFFLMIPICLLDFDLCPSRKAMKSMKSGRRPLL
jgi:hypothetical protein